MRIYAMNTRTLLLIFALQVLIVISWKHPNNKVRIVAYRIRCYANQLFKVLLLQMCCGLEVYMYVPCFA